MSFAPCREGRGGEGRAVAASSTSTSRSQQQLQQLSQHAAPLPLVPHPSSTQPPSLSTASSGLLALSGALMAQVQLAKEHRVAQHGESRGKGMKHSWVNP
ncbi:hypothetical protein EK904_007627 [Melospiza melodia maxima]|nr:hypothetical protein EK904_007627 [Melospiza melodia maxima]